MLHRLLLGFTIFWVLSFRDTCRCGGGLVTLGPPLNDEIVAVLFKLSVDTGTVLVLDGDLFGELAFQGLRLDYQLSLLIFSRLAGVLHKFIHGCHVLGEKLRTRLAHVSVETRERLRI